MVDGVFCPKGAWLKGLVNGLWVNNRKRLFISPIMKRFTRRGASAQFEVNLSTEELQMLLNHTFTNWTVIKSTVQEQQSDIPREYGICELKTNVVSFVARK